MNKPTDVVKRFLELYDLKNGKDSFYYAPSQGKEFVKLQSRMYQNEKIREFVEARLKIAEFTMDEHVKNPHEEKSKQESEEYWQAVNMFKILTGILEDSRK